MIQLNLLPDVKKEFIKAQQMKGKVISISVMVTIGSLGVALLLAVIVYAVQPGYISVKQGEINSKSEDLRAVTDIEKYLTIQNQLETLPELHDGKAVYSRLLDYLKVLNPAPPNNIRLSSLQVNQETNTLLFSGTTDNFQAFSVFQDTLSNAEITYESSDGSTAKEKLFEDNGVRIQNQSLSNSQGKQELVFSIEAIYRDAAFSPATSNIKLEVPNIQTTQSITGTPGRATAPLFDDSSDGLNDGEGQ